MTRSLGMTSRSRVAMLAVPSESVVTAKLPEKSTVKFPSSAVVLPVVREEV